MYQLNHTHRDALRPLFQELDIHLAVTGILEGSVPARIYVDHPIQPQAALVLAKHRFFLAGSAHNAEFNQALGRYFTETVYPQALEAGQRYFVLYYAPSDWKGRVGMILKDKYPIQVQRQYYTITKLKNDWRASLPEGFSLQLVDAALLEGKQLKNLEALREEMCSELESVDDFLTRSFGVCLVHGDEIAGWCLSEYNTADRCEVGIEIREPYRRRGFATLLASALIEYAFMKGMSRVGWHCYTSNTPSVATALKVGFEKVCDYPVYI